MSKKQAEQSVVEETDLIDEALSIYDPVTSDSDIPSGEQSDGQTPEPVTSEPTVIPGLTEGRIVHYVMENGNHRPAIIVQVWDHGTGMSNLQVFLDGSNDGHAPNDGVQWIGSVFYSEEATPGTWHWIEKA